MNFIYIKREKPLYWFKKGAIFFIYSKMCCTLQMFRKTHTYN